MLPAKEQRRRQKTPTINEFEAFPGIHIDYFLRSLLITTKPLPGRFKRYPEPGRVLWNPHCLLVDFCPIWAPRNHENGHFSSRL